MDRNTPKKSADTIKLPVAAGEIIYMGNMVTTNAMGCAILSMGLYAMPVFGVAMETVDNSEGGNGDAHVLIQHGMVFLLQNDQVVPVAEDGIFDVVHVRDSITVCNDVNAPQVAGINYGVVDEGVWVYIPTTGKFF